MTNAEIDRRIATEVMGWRLTQSPRISDSVVPVPYYDCDGATVRCDRWLPSTNISHAMQVVEKIGGQWQTLRTCDGEWSITQCFAGGKSAATHPQKTLAMAISLAALAWADAKKGTQ